MSKPPPDILEKLSPDTARKILEGLVLRHALLGIHTDEQIVNDLMPFDLLGSLPQAKPADSPTDDAPNIPRALH